MSLIDPDDFDFDELDAAADAYAKVERASQRREARKLKPLIERLLSRQPAMLTNDVVKVLRTTYRGGALPTTTTFVREVGSICKEVRDGIAKRRGGVSKPRPARQHVSPGAGVGSASQRGPIIAPIRPSPAAMAAAPEIKSEAPAVTHPLEIYAGGFGGKVYVHGPQIRAFFVAVEKRLDDRTLKALALQIQADAASHGRLADLHPKDRSILEAALALA